MTGTRWLRTCAPGGKPLRTTRACGCPRHRQPRSPDWTVGQDVTVVCTVFGGQQHAVTVEAGPQPSLDDTRLTVNVTGVLLLRLSKGAPRN